MLHTETRNSWTVSESSMKNMFLRIPGSKLKVYLNRTRLVLHTGSCKHIQVFSSVPSPGANRWWKLDWALICEGSEMEVQKPAGSGIRSCSGCVQASLLHQECRAFSETTDVHGSLKSSDMLWPSFECDLHIYDKRNNRVFRGKGYLW